MKRFIYSGLVVLFLAGLSPLQAQDENEKGTIKIDLAYIQQDDQLPALRATAKTKKGKKFESVEGVELNLFFKEENATGFMGRLKTNHKGVVSLRLPEKFKSNWDSLASLTFIATLIGDKRFADQSTEIEITKAKIELTLKEADSVRTIHAKVLARQDSSWVVVSEAEIKLVVRRLLSDLNATEEETYTTDENGEISADFNLTIPGDIEGNIIIGAKIDDHELYGNLLTTKEIKWGVPVAHDDSFAKRTLWATRDKTPLWLLIFPNLIIACVWGIIFYLIYQISRIVKLGKTNGSI